MLQWKKTFPIISYGLVILINSTGISFPMDLGSGNSISTLGKVKKKFLPAALCALGRNFFDLPKSVGNVLSLKLNCKLAHEQLQAQVLFHEFK